MDESRGFTRTLGERYEFLQGGRLVSLDFSFNGKEQWTGIWQAVSETPAGTKLKRRITNSREG
jgi:hypothetical protein